jgi:hypothetical protein
MMEKIRASIIATRYRPCVIVGHDPDTGQASDLMNSPRRLPWRGMSTWPAISAPSDAAALASGTTTEGREELQTVLDFLRRGDVLMVTRIDRLARSIGDLQAGAWSRD